jgi:hypothetical protein
MNPAQELNNTNTITDITEVIIDVKKKETRGRKKIPEDERKVYVQKPRPGYHIKYYHDSKLYKKVNCEICNCEVTLQKLKRHQTTKKCTAILLTKYSLVDEVEEI